jgi:hypothetical protein
MPPTFRPAHPQPFHAYQFLVHASHLLLTLKNRPSQQQLAFEFDQKRLKSILNALEGGLVGLDWGAGEVGLCLV